MAKYTVKCEECGEDMTVQLVGPHKDREYKLENWSWVCDDCAAKARAEAGAKAADENKEMGLPNLTGTEKQIAWAEQIRAQHVSKGCKKMIGEVAGYLSRNHKELCEEAAKTINPEKFDRMVDDCWTELVGKTSASWWIDHRDSCDLLTPLCEAVSLALQDFVNPPVETDPAAQSDAVEEVILVPECETSTRAICEIKITEEGVSVLLPEKIEKFRLMVKDAGFYWEKGRWFNGAAGRKEERAAWIGFNALALGIRVVAHNEAVREAIKAGNVKGQWITASKDQTCFLLSWWAGDWYDRCRKLPGSRWSKPFVTVPREYAAEVADFAAVEGWGITERAEMLINAGLNTETVNAELPDPNPQDRPSLSADDFGINENLED